MIKMSILLTLMNLLKGATYSQDKRKASLANEMIITSAWRSLGVRSMPFAKELD